MFTASLRCSSLIFSVACLFALHGFAQAQSEEYESSPNHGYGYFGMIPFDGKVEDALAASAAGSTIPMATIHFTASKNKKSYSDVIVGADPYTSTTTTAINVVIVPLIVEIGSTTFNPTAPDSCIAAGVTPLKAFQQSPLLKSVVYDGGLGQGHGATMNGVNVGTTTYNDAFRRAEFWTKLASKTYHTTFKVTTLSPWTISASEVQKLGGGNVLTTNCADLGVLPTTSFQNYIANTVIPGISAIAPTTFPIFLMKDVVTTKSTGLTCQNGCEIGYHSAKGSPVQTYGVSEYDSTSGFWSNSGIKNISVLAHEIGEWMDDPLVTNPTPAWGAIGQVSGCQGNWEVGDPLTGTDFPVITMTNGIKYDPQELAFWSWYYNAEHAASIGAGGRFSAHGTFGGPSKPCPSGGTY
jgi:hypothetical protein